MNISPLVFQTKDKKIISLIFDKNDPVYVFDIGRHETTSLYAFGPAVRPYYLLHLIERGSGTIERNGVVTRLSAGEAFLIYPDETTTYQADEKDPWVYCWISFSGDFAAELIKRTTDQLCMPYQKSGLLALRSALNSEKGGTLDCLRTLLDVLNSIKDEPHVKTDDAITTALAYLENNYFRPIDVQALASQLGYSRAYFTTLFTKRTGETPYGYLTKTRIEKAKAYLSNDQRSIEEIAYSVGFSSMQRFSEMFKTQTGLSPLQYRKRNTI
jgi:AraC-like DNA-binding protein